jgi:hypothetical protein
VIGGEAITRDALILRVDCANHTQFADAHN